MVFAARRGVVIAAWAALALLALSRLQYHDCGGYLYARTCAGIPLPFGHWAMVGWSAISIQGWLM